MQTVGNIARHGKPLTVAVLVLFAFLTGYTSFHYHHTAHRHGTCTFEAPAHDSGEQIAASQTNCNLCYYAASPRIAHPTEHTGGIESGMFLPSIAEQSSPQYGEEYTSPLRGPPSLSHS